MSVQEFKLRSESLTYDSNNVRQYSRSGFVETSEDEDAYDIYKSGSVPQIGDEHPSDEGAFVTNMSVSWDRNNTYRAPNGDLVNPYRKMWNTEVTYKNVYMKNWNALPWERGAYNVNFDVIPYQYQLRQCYRESGEKQYKDINVVNTVKDPLYLETTLNNILLRFDYDTKEFSPTWFETYIGSVNKEAITIAGYPLKPQKSKIKKLQPTNQIYDDGTEYFKVSVEIEIESEIPVRYKKILNAGFNLKNSSSANKREPIYLTKVHGTSGGEYKAYSQLTDQEKTEADKITEVVPISENGTSVINPETGTIIYIKFYDTWLEGWTTLGLPAKSEERVSVN